MAKRTRAEKFIGLLDLSNLQAEVVQHIMGQKLTVQPSAKLGHDGRVSVTEPALVLARLAGGEKQVQIGDRFGWL